MNKADLYLDVANYNIRFSLFNMFICLLFLTAKKIDKIYLPAAFWIIMTIWIVGIAIWAFAMAKAIKKGKV